MASLYLDTVTAALEDAGFAVCSHIFPSGEGRKNLSTLTELLEFLASEHLTRTDCVAALGGGVTGDMAGFAAAVYLRGIRYVQLPTTLLAAVDSSVGGKTAVDLTAGKNLAGAFCQPAAVIDPSIKDAKRAVLFYEVEEEGLEDGEERSLVNIKLIFPALHKNGGQCDFPFSNVHYRRLPIRSAIAHNFSDCSTR